MTEQSERIPVDEEYLRALGRATYNFVYLEWSIICLTETLQKGFVKKASPKTARDISNSFCNEVKLLDDTRSFKVPLQALAGEFSQIVIERNCLMHANPYTAKTGEQRMRYDGPHGHRDWTIELMTEFSGRTAAAAREAGNLLHNMPDIPG